MSMVFFGFWRNNNKKAVGTTLYAIAKVVIGLDWTGLPKRWHSHFSSNVSFDGNCTAAWHLFVVVVFCCSTVDGHLIQLLHHISLSIDDEAALTERAHIGENNAK